MNTVITNGKPQNINELSSIKTLIAELKLRPAAAKPTLPVVCPEDSTQAPPPLLTTPFSKYH